MDLYSRQETARTYECGPDCQLKPDALLHLIQETAEEHASILGFGSSFCMEKNVAWVEIRLAFRITRLPRWRETVSVTTWTYASSPLVALRDFLIKDSEGNTIVEASSQWVLIDREKRRPVPLKKLLPDFPPIDTPPLVADDKHLSFPEEGTEARIFQAEKMDVDFNNHINNAVYLTWALNSLPEEWCLGKSIRSMEIVFKKETLAGEKISSRLRIEGNESYHSLCSENGEHALVHLMME